MIFGLSLKHVSFSIGLNASTRLGEVARVAFVHLIPLLPITYLLSPLTSLVRPWIFLRVFIQPDFIHPHFVNSGHHEHPSKLPPSLCFRVYTGPAPAQRATSPSFVVAGNPDTAPQQAIEEPPEDQETTQRKFEWCRRQLVRLKMVGTRRAVLKRARGLKAVLVDIGKTMDRREREMETKKMSSKDRTEEAH